MLPLSPPNTRVNSSGPSHRQQVTAEKPLLPELADYSKPPSKALMDGLTMITTACSQRFDATTDIKKIELIQNTSSGELTGIKLTCTTNPDGLVRMLPFSIQAIHDCCSTKKEVEPDVFTIEFNPREVERFPYAATIQKFNTTSADKLEIAHLDAIPHFESVLNEINPWIGTPIYEQRLTNFDTNTKTASGPLDSVMVKFTLWPNSGRAYLKTMDNFNKEFIPALVAKLGVENFNRLVRAYGQALDKSAFLVLNPNALAEGIFPLSAFG